MEANRSGESVATRNTIGRGPRNHTAISEVKETIAGGLRGVADALRRTGSGSTAGSARDYAEQASHWLDRAADEVRAFDPAQLKSDVQRKVRENPGRSLAVAAAAGLAVGILLRRR